MPHRTPTSRMDALLARAAGDRLAIVRPQALAALAELHAAGVDAEIVGSLARKEFRINSDVDFLILSCGHASESDVFSIVERHLRDAQFDLVFSDRIAPERLAFMRADAAPRGSTS